VIDSPRNRGLGSFRHVVPLLANLVPVAGVLFLGWDLFLVLALFWVENLVIGLFGILRVAFATGERLPRRIVHVLFFCVHYGGFMLAHALLLIAVFGASARVDGGVTDMRGFVDYLLRVDVALAVVALVVAHGEAFVYGVLRGRFVSTRDAMVAPYRRIFITQVGLILGGFAVEQFGQPVLGLVALIAAKIAVDLRMQRRDESRPSTGDAAGSSPL
jgi:hypothetical protein